MPPDNQQLIGQTHERVKGQGVGADPELGAEVARQDRHELERSLVVVAGPTDEFSRKGLERARQWVEEETESMDVLAGDSPQPSVDRLSAVVALSNPTNVQRVDELQGQAVDAKGNMQAQEEARDDAIQDLITDDAGELDPI